MSRKHVIHFDHWDQAFADDPFPTYRQLRRKCPIAWSNAHDGFWVVSRHAFMEEVMHRPDLFSSRYVSVPRDIGFGDLPLPPLNLDPPAHKRVKQLLIPGFTPTRVAELEATTRAITNRLIDQFASSGRCDVSADYAKSVPIAVLCQIFGLPPEDEELFVGWVHRIIQHGGQDHDDATKAGTEMFQYFATMLEARRSEPADDLVSFLAQSEVEGKRLTDDEILGSCSVLVLAGIDTTWSTLGSALWHLARHGEHRRQLVSEPGLINTAVEEFLRVFAPTSVGRMVTQDTHFHGVEMRAGQMVFLPLPCANRDEDTFPDSEEIVLDRQPNRHATFGLGIHRCLGANLARMELRVALEEFLARIPEFQLASETDVDWTTGPMRGPRRLPIVFRPPVGEGHYPADGARA